MAESATGKTSSGNWWKSLTVRKKPKEVSVYSASVSADATEDRTYTGTWTVGSGALSSSTGSRENQHPNYISIEGTDSDPKSDKMFSEKTGRRNLKISRSGRFKEKRKVRASLPESPKFFEENPSNENDERQ
ncbi:proline-rich protein 15 [Bombina bombina]|uniref:proline-rich protein 15 n=1 Tax=Bombina bombina TaxID=8345 RepID=UPI00235AC354|nr:proline-rich protein 15 [Bombina bombina]